MFASCLLLIDAPEMRNTDRLRAWADPRRGHVSAAFVSSAMEVAGGRVPDVAFSQLRGSRPHEVDRGARAGDFVWRQAVKTRPSGALVRRWSFDLCSRKLWKIEHVACPSAPARRSQSQSTTQIAEIKRRTGVGELGWIGHASQLRIGSRSSVARVVASQTPTRN